MYLRGAILVRLRDAVKNWLAQNAGERLRLRVQEVFVGVRYTYVVLGDGSIGIHYTPLEDYGDPPDPESLEGASVSEIINMASSTSMVRRAVAHAAINAVSEPIIRGMRLLRGSLTEIAGIQGGTAAMLGYMEPIAKELESKGVKVYILERNPMHKGRGVLPDTMAEEILPGIDYLIATGAALAEPTIDRILDLTRNAKMRIVVGPSSTLVPQPLFSAGFSIVGGSLPPLDPRRRKLLLEYIRLGHGYHSFSKFMEKYFVVKRSE